MAKRVFVSFDYDHDLDLKNALVAQSRLPDSPFEIIDWSIKTASLGWRVEALRRIRASDVVVVICGERTDQATGVSIELSIAQQQCVDYFLLWGRADRTCVKPVSATTFDKIYSWTWPILKDLIGGAR